MKLLKTFMMETINNLTELRRAERSTEAEARYDSMFRGSSHAGVRRPYGDGSTFPSDPVGGCNTYEPPITWSPLPISSASKSEKKDAIPDDGVDDDTNSKKFKDQNAQDGTGPAGDASNTEAVV